MEAFIDFIYQYSYFGIFLLLFLGVLALPVPVETLMAFSGFMASQNKLVFILVVVAAFFGTAAGVTPGFFIGKRFGHSIIQKFARAFYIKDRYLDETIKWNKKLGRVALLISCFIPGVRHLIGLFAGASQISFVRYAVFTYISGLLWVTSFVSLGYYFGEQWRSILKIPHHVFFPALSIFIFGAIVFLLKMYVQRKPA